MRLKSDQIGDAYDEYLDALEDEGWDGDLIADRYRDEEDESISFRMDEYD